MKPKEARRCFRLGSGRFINVPCEPGRSPAPKTPTIWPSLPSPGLHRGESKNPPGQGSRLLGQPPPGTVVTLLGCGSVGCSVGCYLADMGCDLIAIDRDVVEAVNIQGRRTGYPERMIGMPKAMALAQMLKEWGCKASVHAIHCGLEKFSDDELQALAHGSAAVAALLDDAPELFRLNRALYNRARVVYAAFHRGAASGHVFWTAPGVPCLKCALGLRSPDGLHTLHAEPALPLDIQRISQVTARVVLWLVAPEGSDAQGLLDPSRNILFLHNRPSEDLERALSAELLPADIDPDCDVCGAFLNRERG